ncbi:MAG: nucleotidyltransferase domain-containing protein [Verrucomicrobiota bacterium]
MPADPAPFALRIRQAALECSLTSGQGAPADLVPHARSFLAAARQAQLDAHREGVPASAVARLRSDAVDLVVESLHARAGAPAAALSMVATGGYGRAELCPLSDVDLLVLVPSHSPESKAAVESILYPLWDLGLKLSQSRSGMSPERRSPSGPAAPE